MIPKTDCNHFFTYLLFGLMVILGTACQPELDEDREQSLFPI